MDYGVGFQRSEMMSQMTESIMLLEVAMGILRFLGNHAKVLDMCSFLVYQIQVLYQWYDWRAGPIHHASTT